MAIGTDDTIFKFGGTAPEEITSSPATVVDGAFSVAGDVSQFTNTDDAMWATFLLQLTAALSGIPDVGAAVQLYSRLMNIDGTEDAQIPQDDYENIWLGTFPVLDLDGAQNIPMPYRVELPKLYTQQVHEFYIKNSTGVSLGTTWQLWISDLTPGPSA